MKLSLLTILWVLTSGFASYSQEKKSTLDRALETTNGILNLLDKHNSTQASKPSAEATVTGKFSIINNTGKRLTIIIKSTSQSLSFDKTIVLGIDDKETIPDLKLGAYSYTAKFEDGTVAKSGDIEFTNENLIWEKVVK